MYLSFVGQVLPLILILSNLSIPCPRVRLWTLSGHTDLIAEVKEQWLTLAVFLKGSAGYRYTTTVHIPLPLTQNQLLTCPPKVFLEQEMWTSVFICTILTTKFCIFKIVSVFTHKSGQKLVPHSFFLFHSINDFTILNVLMIFLLVIIWIKMLKKIKVYSLIFPTRKFMHR